MVRLRGQLASRVLRPIGGGGESLREAQDEASGGRGPGWWISPFPRLQAPDSRGMLCL